MRQRLGLAAALLGDPAVLVLDEPANGLDPQGIRWLRDLLRCLAAEGRAVLVSSHILAEVAQTADDVVIIHRGRTIDPGPAPGPAGHPPRRQPGRHLPRTDRHPRRRTVMTRLIRAEALRLATTRTYWLLAAGAIAVIAGGIAPTAAATSFTPGTSPARAVLAIAGLAQTVALIAGALSVTGEFRHKTITPAVLITPRRTPLLAAKLITLAAAGLAFGLAATGMATAITLPLLAARHIPAGVSATGAAAIIAGGAIATALAAALGVGVGAIIRNQAGAIIAVLALLYVAEPRARLHPRPRPRRPAVRPRRPGRRHHPAPRASPPAPTCSGNREPRSSWPATPPRPCSPAPRCCAAATSPPDCAWPGRPRGPARMIAGPGQYSRPPSCPPGLGPAKVRQVTVRAV